MHIRFFETEKTSSTDDPSLGDQLGGREHLSAAAAAAGVPVLDELVLLPRHLQHLLRGARENGVHLERRFTSLFTLKNPIFEFSYFVDFVVFSRASCSQLMFTNMHSGFISKM